MCFLILGLHWHKLVQYQSKICAFPFPIRILRSATHSIPRPNCSISPLTYTLRTSQILNPSYLLHPPTTNITPTPLKYRKKSQTLQSWVNHFLETYAPPNRLYHPPAVASIRQLDAVFSSLPSSDFLVLSLFVSSGFWLGRRRSVGRGVSGAMRTNGVSDAGSPWWRR